MTTLTEDVELIAKALGKKFQKFSVNDNSSLKTGNIKQILYFDQNNKQTK